MKKVFGLLGYPLHHSFSGKYFQKKFLREGLTDHEYHLFPLEKIDMFPELIKKQSPAGMQVTIPYKESVIKYLDEMDEEALAAGAVNTITFSNQRTKGYNSDIYGFEKMFLPLLFACERIHPKALILGTGGASKAVIYILKKLGIEYRLVSRNPEKGLTYDQLDEGILEETDFIINTTPLGTFPDESTFPPLPYHMIKKSHFLIDLVYNPKITVFLTKGLQQGATVKNGLDMLIYQAEKSWEIWNQK